ncbi:flagellar hook-basal body complex protein FliE [Bacillus carboniphilus]|uniref:Flagellar hook-basal body complex protein FliE n=1 Tax=Bacillus carboniphilus TaxID=86663 RepID=A0ABY9JXM3_9BACI|nr:flagellar hook-basal body complex protein FliE [Bacillus carboniphilus]WLR43544.1 flagellar hook-basal body complex protein FliE [Bacillus carboniphilus]
MINSITPISTQAIAQYSSSITNSNQNFSTYLKEALKETNELQVQSDKLTTMMANGHDVDLDQVMIAAEKANVALQATLEVRNKVIESYQEIMRMQI